MIILYVTMHILNYFKLWRSQYMHWPEYGKHLTWISNPATYGGHGCDTTSPGSVGGQHSRPSHIIGHTDLSPERICDFNIIFFQVRVSYFLRNKILQELIHNLIILRTESIDTCVTLAYNWIVFFEVKANSLHLGNVQELFIFILEYPFTFILNKNEDQP